MDLPVKRYKFLDVFRGIAIIWIVCFHVLKDLREEYGVILNYLISYGYLGVQIFFVTSGYGIAASIYSGKYKEPFNFLLRRLKRIYFPYWWHLLFAVLIIPISSSLVLMLKSHTFALTIVNYDIFEWFQLITLSKVFSSANWKLHRAFLPLNSVIWYISIIAQIYIFLALSLYIKKHISNILFMMFVFSLLTDIPSVKGILPYGIFIPFFAQFYVGIIVYYVLHNGQVLRGKMSRYFMVLLSGMAVFYCAYSNSDLLRLSFSIFVGSVYIILHEHDEQLSKLFCSKILLLIGTFSYSLYLLHVPLWPFVGMFTQNLVPLFSELGEPFFLVPGIIILSFIWYLFFEKPSTQKELINHISNPFAVIRSGMRDALLILNRKKSNNRINSDC